MNTSCFKQYTHDGFRRPVNESNFEHDKERNIATGWRKSLKQSAFAISRHSGNCYTRDTNKRIMNANDQLTHHSGGSDTMYRHTYGLLFTTGVKDLADQYKCWWFLDVIVSYQSQLKAEDFQTWELTKYDDNSCLVRCTNGNGKQLCSQEIEYTDFPATTATLWLVNDVILLPCEY